MAQAGDPLFNPYAPPKAEEGRSKRRSRYADERRSVVLMIVLSIVTIGFYPCVWYVRRTPFFEKLDADKRVGGLQWVLLAMTAASYVVAFLRGAQVVTPDVVRLVELPTWICSLILAFRVAHMLRSDFARSGRSIGISSLGVFFLGCWYLQHVINVAADTPAFRRKRKRKTPEGAPAEPSEPSVPVAAAALPATRSEPEA